MKKLLSLAFTMMLSSCSYIVIVHDPLSAKEHVELGYTYEKQKDYKDAIYQYKMAIKKDSNYDLAYFNLGNVFFKEKKYDDAIKCYKKAIKINPKNTDALNNLAYTYYKLGDFKKAKFYILKALKLKPDNKAYQSTLEEINNKL
ncbi:tetratricopeptide repeat protein [Hydrogenobaculum acidophilum]